MRFCPLVIKEHTNRHANNDAITENTISVRNLLEQEEAQQCRKNNLRIVIDRNIFRGCVEISVGNTKLSAGCGKSCTNQREQLLPCHWLIVQQ